MKKEHWFKRAMYLCVIICTLITSIVGAINYFAKNSTVSLLDKRLELAIEDDKVFRAESDVEWMEQQTAFERRKEPRTVTEEEMIEHAKARVAKLKKQREQKQKAYEQAK
jgi:hypothetical protein